MDAPVYLICNYPNSSRYTSRRQKALVPPPSERDNDGPETGDKEASSHNGLESITGAHALDNGRSCQKVKQMGRY